jgi:hypothetical protein
MGFAKDRMMELEERGFGEVEGSLCLAHVVDVPLSRRLAGRVEESECTFCGREESTADNLPFAVSLEALLYEVMETIRYFYQPAVEVLSWDNEDGYIGSQSDTWEVFDEIADGVFDEEVGTNVAEQVIDALGHHVWTQWSSPADVEDLEYAWDEFTHTVRHTSRFVLTASSDSASPPARTAHFLEKLLMYVEADLGLVTDFPEGGSFFRGRLCDNPQRLHGDSRDLGPAPGDVATANRMSPAGISFFYASGDAGTAVAEIAGHGVEPFAVVGEFTNRRTLRVLDLTRTPPRISPFDVERREQAKMTRFLKSFIDHVAQPVIPDGRQHIEYAPTQVLTEFLRWVPEPKLDGIVLPSVQTGRSTYVLFFGPEAFGTKGDVEPEHVKFPGLEDIADIDSDLGWLFELDPQKIVTYRVERTYTAKETGSTYHAAEPRLRKVRD